MAGEDWRNLVAAAMAVLFALVALVPAVMCLSSERAVRVVDVVVQARCRVPEPARRRGWRALGVGVLFLAAAVVTLLVPPKADGLVLGAATFCTLFLRARPLESVRERQPQPPTQTTSSDPVQLQKPYYPDRKPPDQ